MAQVKKNNSDFRISKLHLKRLQNEFNEKQCIRLPAFLDPKIVGEVQEKIRSAVFYNRVHKDIALESCMKPNKAVELLNFLFNDPRLFDLIRTITGAGPIGCFVGRIYKMVPGGPHYDTWHGDLVEGRLLAMSINLSEGGAYEGGELQIKDKPSGKILCKIKHSGSGGMIMFRIAKNLRHRVLPIEGNVPRMVYAGWFRSHPPFMELLTSGYSKRKTDSKIKRRPLYGPKNKRKAQISLQY